MDKSIAIIPPAVHRQRGVDARKANHLRDSHGMRWDAPALPAWLAGWDAEDRQARIGANRRNEQFVER